jgi:hypothetical protein
VPATEKPLRLSGFKTLTGTPKQVGDRLEASTAEQVVALTVQHGSGAAIRALAETVVGIAPLLGAILERRQRETLVSILEALVPAMPPPQHLLIEARMAAQARRAVLEGCDWLTSAQIADLAGFSSTNPGSQPSKWKRSRQIFAIRHSGVDYFPAYGLDAASGYRPIKSLAPVLDVFGRTKDDWGLAYWFASVNSFLGGSRPQDVLQTAPERVLAAAVDEAAGVLHG